MKFKRFIIFIAIIILFLYFNNNYIYTSKIKFKSSKIPNEFKGFRIVHLSDLHSKRFGKNQRYLISKVKSQKPDIIVFTGDLVDKRKYDENPPIELMRELVKIAPVYYVTGNHENWSDNFKSLEVKLKDYKVNILHNEYKEIKIKNSSIYIAGIDEPSVQIEVYREYSITDSELKKCASNLNKNKFKILLAHRPDLISLYSKYGFDLIFSGHAHGGQVRIPFIGGIVAPNQGFFPKYTSGLYNFNKSSLVVSRGLGNSIFPFRIFNCPNIVVVTLEK
ncbi:MAG: metallophosphoesterase [Caloramator sp.]|nr:metallophosphoesterase [Caloramator sp.]